MYAYTPEFQEKAADELDAIKAKDPSSRVVTLVEHYGKTREATRECLALSK